MPGDYITTAWHSCKSRNHNKMKTKYEENPTENLTLNDAQIGFAQNTEPRCPCAVLIDVSGSMKGKPIAEANAGLQDLKTKLVEDSLACLRVELALVTFTETVKVEVDFCSPDQFNPPILTTGGGTSLGAAIIKTLEILKARCAEYRAAGISHYRPWLIVITDAHSGDDIFEAARQVKEAESQKKLAFFGIGVQTVDMASMASLSLRPPLHLDGLKFQELFEWLSVNLSSVAVSRPGDQVALTAPTWATV